MRQDCVCVCVYLRGEGGKSSKETVIQIQFVSYDKDHIGEAQGCSEIIGGRNRFWYNISTLATPVSMAFSPC